MNGNVLFLPAFVPFILVKQTEKSTLVTSSSTTFFLFMCVLALHLSVLVGVCVHTSHKNNLK